MNHCFHRCIFRNKPAVANDSVILPASFPAAEPEPECAANPLDLSDTDMDHVECFGPAFAQLLIHDIASFFTCV